MTARRRAAILTAREFRALRENRLVDVRRLVANVEAAFRQALRVEALTDDAIIRATLDRSNQTAAERAGLDVVRACLAFREAPASDADFWLDRIGLALADAEPMAITGASLREGGRAGGVASGRARDPREKDEYRELTRRIRAEFKAGRKPRVSLKGWYIENKIPKSTFYDLVKRIEAEPGRPDESPVTRKRRR